MENQLAPVNLIFFHISPLKSLNLALILGAKMDAHRGTWTGCKKVLQLPSLSIFELILSTIQLLSKLIHREIG